MMKLFHRPAVRVTLIIGIVCLVILAMLPRLVSSRFVYGRLLERLKAENFKLDVADVRLRWFDSISVRGITIEQLDRPGFRLLSIDEVKTNKGILGFIFSPDDLGRIEVQSPTIDVELLHDGSNVGNLVKAVGGGKRDNQPEQAVPQLSMDIHVNDASVVVRKGSAAEPLVVVPPWDVDLSVRSIEGDAMLRVEPAGWLDRVKLTPELMNLGLELAIPALAKSAWIDGDVSLSSGPIEIPLNRPLESRGLCTIELHHVRAGLQQPAMIAVTNMLAKLVRTDADGEVQLVDESVIEVELKDGYVYHQGARFGLPRIDQRLQVETSGRVGIVDRALEATLTLPVPLQWLARTDEVKQMGVPTIKLPISGTLDEPQIQWMDMRKDSAELLSMIRLNLDENATAKTAAVGVLEGLASGSGDDAIRATADLLSRLREARQKRSGQRAPGSDEVNNRESETTEDSVAPETRRTPLRDLLRRRD